MEKLSSKIEAIDEYLRWIHNFLLNRSHPMCHSKWKKKSKNLPVTSGVPQGSVLGPVLFLVFINDLPKEVDCQVALFSDDTLMYQTIKCSHDTLKFQENLTALSKWADRWGMDFNGKKSKILLFNYRGKFPHYSLHGDELEIVEEVKYLGIIIQSNMKFTAHIQRKLMTANQQLDIIKRALYWAPTNAKLLAYKTLCLSHL